MIICSNHDDQIEAISCDHSKEELDIAKTKALLLNRNIFLEVDNPTKPNVSLDLTYITSPTSTTLQFRIDGGTTRFFLDFYYGGGQLDTFETSKLNFSKIRFSTPNNGQNFY